MVMHARKIARLTDGYNEKLETHPLQAVDKLLSKKNGNGQHTNTSKDEVQDGDLSSRRSESPNYRPTSESNSPRTFKNKVSLMQKQRDRQRGPSTGTSPAENSHNNLGSQHAARNSSEHKNSTHEKKINEILAKANQWTEHISSSGKKYYYNCKTEVSQWEKPKEWLEREKLQKLLYASKEKMDVKQHSGTSNSANINSSSKSGDVKHSTEVSSSSSSALSSSSSSRDRYSANKTGSGKGLDKQPSSTSQSRSGSSTPSTPNTPNLLKTRSNELSNNNRSSDFTQKDSVRGMDMLRGSSLSLATDAHGRLKNLVANAPRIERIESKRASSVSPGTPSPGPSQRNHLPNQHSQPMSSVHGVVSSSRSPSVDKPNNVDSKIEDSQDRLSNPSPLSAASASDLTSPVFNPSPRQQASATPVSSSTVTASSQQDSPDSKKFDVKRNSSPTTIRKTSTNLDDFTKGSSSISTTIAPVLEEPVLTKEQPLPLITHSLARHCDDSLISHVTGWSSEHVERQARKISDESHLLAAESASQVSVDLKYARSLVRASEIQVTLQEQRLHFLQQQVKELERLKSENAFMS